MPRKKQTVQKKKRSKVYREGELSGSAESLKPKGFFRFFHNYALFALIGVGALAAGVVFSAIYQGGGSTNGDTGVRGEGVTRRTPEPGSTPGEDGTSAAKQYAAPPAVIIDTTKTYTATLKTAKGDIVIELFDDDVPQTVNNFVFLAREHFYDGVSFHRVVPGFIAQAGDPTGTGSGGPGYELSVEKTSDEFGAGIVAMAKPQEAGSPNNGSQFFITLDDEPTFAGKFTAFGRVVSGMDVLDELRERIPEQRQETERGDVIESVTVQET
jgi:cyclophilin family peptidyl-prolyl cis-trans isomerase